jgi:hypothetical protein
VVANPKDSKYDIAPPSALSSPEYTADLAEVYNLGAKDSTQRTPYQTDTAAFWADGANTSAIVGHFYQIAQAVLPNNTNALDAANLFSRIGAAAWDASIVGWIPKYK